VPVSGKIRMAKEHLPTEGHNGREITRTAYKDTKFRGKREI